jgi:ligand-binding sensor domain-containing protein
MKTLLMSVSSLLLLGIAYASCSRTQEAASFHTGTEDLTSIELPQPLSWTDTTLQLYSSIQLIFEDSKGNLWFGTANRGICKFDGKQYTYFKEIDGPWKNNLILSIQEDSRGNIWIQSTEMLLCYNGTSFKHYPLENRMQTPEARRAQQQYSKEWNTAPKSIWFRAGADGQVVQIDGEHIRRLSIPKPNGNSPAGNSYNPYWVFSVLQDSQDQVWLGTLSGGLVQYSGKHFSYLGKEEIKNAIVSLFEDAEHNIWIGTEEGEVYVYNDEGLHNFSNAQHFKVTDEKGTPRAIWAITEDKAGNMWFGTEGSGAWKYDGNQFTNYNLDNGLPDLHILTINQDQNGTLWFGTARGAVVTLKGNSFHLENENYLSDGC